MKNHLILSLRPEASDFAAPHWIDEIEVNPSASESIHPEVDKLLKRYQIPVKVTREYAPQNGKNWSEDEKQSGLNRIYRLVLKKKTNIPPDLIKAITLIPDVEYARIGTIGSAPIPKASALSRRRQTDQQSRDTIYLNEAHRFTRGDDSITIAVLDTGVSLDHPEYQSALLEGYDFVDIISGAEEFFGDYLGADPIPSDEWVGHGSHVTGIIAAVGDQMPTGVVPNCKILPVRVLGAMRQAGGYVGAGLVDNINVGVKFAVDQGAQVINMSLGIRHTGGGLPHQAVVDYAQRKGVSIIAAAGNDGTNMVYYPSGHPYVITVGAVDETGHVAQFSTYGQHVDFVAPGTNIYSTYLGSGYAFSSGTSHAAPFVSGAVAMLKSFAKKVGHGLRDGQIKYILKHSSDKVGRRFKDFKAGYGLINMRDALTLLEYKFNLN